MKKKTRAKAVPYELIPEHGDVGAYMYRLLSSIVEAHHDELSKAQARIALAWSLNWKADVDGRLTLGKCKKATDLDRELAPYDFVILLNREFWQQPLVNEVQRRALLDHELMHAAVAYDKNGEPKVDERGRRIFRVRKHDLEEFSDIAARYGCWKRDIEAFADALRRAEHVGWVGFTALQETLTRIGVIVPIDTIKMWDTVERRDVLTWALLREAAGVETANVLSPTTPQCLAAALQPVPA